MRIYIYHISYMKELALKYGCNPNQKPSRVYMEEGELPFEVLNGRPGYINLLDALNSWQLVKELKAATSLPIVSVRRKPKRLRLRAHTPVKKSSTTSWLYAFRSHSSLSSTTTVS